MSKGVNTYSLEEKDEEIEQVSSIMDNNENIEHPLNMVDDNEIKQIKSFEDGLVNDDSFLIQNLNLTDTEQKFLNEVFIDKNDTSQLKNLQLNNNEAIENFAKVSRRILSSDRILYILRTSEDFKRDKKQLIEELKNYYIFFNEDDNDELIKILIAMFYNKELQEEKIIRDKILKLVGKNHKKEIYEQIFKDRTLLLHIVSKFYNKIKKLETNKQIEIELKQIKQDYEQREYQQRELEIKLEKSNNGNIELQATIDDLNNKIKDLENKNNDLLFDYNEAMKSQADSKEIERLEKLVTNLEIKNADLRDEFNIINTPDEANNCDELQKKIELLEEDIQIKEEEINSFKQQINLLEKQHNEEKQEDIQEPENKKLQKNTDISTKKEKVSKKKKKKTSITKIILMSVAVVILLIAGWLVYAFTHTVSHRTSNSSVAKSLPLTNSNFQQKKVKASNFTKIKTKSEMLEYTYAPVGTNITNSIKINNFVFKRLDIVNGWVFQRAQPLFHKAFFTNAKNGNLVVVNLKDEK